MCSEPSTCIVLNTESSLVQVSLSFGSWRAVEESDMSRNFFFFFLLTLFLLIYSDELIKPSLSCHKRPLSAWTHCTKASDAKRWNRGISLQLNWACLFSSLFISPACLSPLSASVCGFQMWCEHSILSDPGSYFVNSRSLPAPHWWYFTAASPQLY